MNNEFVKIEVREDGQIVGYDVKDAQVNGTVFMSQSKRGLSKAAGALKAAFNDAMGFSAAQRFLNEQGIKTHQWCSID